MIPQGFIPRAILFDFDGVLGQTMEDNFRAWQAALTELGLEIGSEEYFLLEGMKLPEVARTLGVKNGITNADWEGVVKRKEDFYKKRNSFTLYPGVIELIKQLREKGVPLAIVSAARKLRLEDSVPAGFLDNFGAIITGEKTERGKPFPDPYLAAAKELGVSIMDCLVVENAPLGIEAAKEAGAFCIAICSTLSQDKLARADQIVKGFRDLAETSPIQSLLI